MRDPTDDVLHEPAGDADGPTTIYEQGPDPDSKVNVRRLPGLCVQGFHIIMAAGRNDFGVSIALQTLAGFGLAVQLVLGQRALSALFTAVQGDGSLASVVPWALAVAVVAFILFFANAVQRERQQILGELVHRHVEARVLDVVTAVDLEAFETPGFFNRLERIRGRADQPLNLVWGLSGLAGAAVGTVGVVIGLFAIEPLLIPMIALVFLPAWLVASRRSESFWRFFWRMTPRDRERRYLAEVLSGRDEAKEVRSFGLAGYLRTRYDRLRGADPGVASGRASTPPLLVRRQPRHLDRAPRDAAVDLVADAARRRDARAGRDRGGRRCDRRRPIDPSRVRGGVALGGRPVHGRLQRIPRPASKGRRETADRSSSPRVRAPDGRWRLVHVPERRRARAA
ncbi:MAG TPA: hypothetical protein VJ774_00340 [Actinomycetota bacterium]|nr:hypothetical protein [Actinomycetota bacterium]